MNIFEFKMLKQKTFKKKMEQTFVRVKKSVEHGANGTMNYIFKKGPKKGDRQ